MLDKFSLYILDKITILRNEIEKDPEEKDTNELLIDELLKILGEYYKSKCVQA